MQYHVVLHHDTLGVTQPALKTLRNELARRADHHICVFEVPADEGDTENYGIIILDKDTSEAVVIGDGFRGDGGGEGGAGHRAAQALLGLWGIRTSGMMPDEAIQFVDNYHAYEAYVSQLAELAQEEGYYQPADNNPHGVDYIFHRR